MAITTRKRKHDGDVESKSRIDDLNDTLLELIFKRLSLWSDLAISKCVSKRWKSIISSPDFTPKLLPQSYAFTLVQSDEECSLTEHLYFQKHKFSLDFIPSRPKLLVANTDDLIVAYHHINSLTGEYYVANPLTKQYIVVSVPLAKPMHEYWQIMVGIAGFVNGVSTLSVSLRNNHNHGFRIVHVLPGVPKSTVQIYSSETGQWKTYLLNGFHYSILDPAVTWKNKIHWLNSSKIVVIDPFNIDNVAPRVVNLPTEIGNYTSTLGVCQNRLRIAQFEETLYPNLLHDEPFEETLYPNLLHNEPFNDIMLHWPEKRIKLWEIIDYDDVDNLGSNYMAKVKLVIDFDCTRSLVECPDIYRSDYPQMICCHPNDPLVVYFYLNQTLFYLNFVEQKCKKVDYGAIFETNAFVLVHPK